MYETVYGNDLQRCPKREKLLAHMDKNWVKLAGLEQDSGGYLTGNVTLKVGPFKIYFNFNNGEVEISEKVYD